MNVDDWLRSLGLGRYETLFRDEAIDSAVLPDLTESDLEKLGIPLGHRKKLIKAIAALDADAATSSVNAAPDAADGAERRQLTIMFCDLVDSTEMSARLDPEDMRAVIADYHKCCTDLIEREGGYVAKYMGDGVLAYFGYPQAHEHDAERAVTAGLSIVGSVPSLKTGDGSALSVRVGIATGTVVVGDLVGSGAAQERGVVGETPNLAARLQSIASPGAVVVSGSTRRLIGDLFDLEDLGDHDLKGIAEQVRAWSVLKASSVESRFEALRRDGALVLVGREEESELLMRRWSRAVGGEGQVVLLSGEAGIGKSHLTAALADQIADTPHTRVRYFCSPQHTDSALYPVIAHMERAAGFADADDAGVRLVKLDTLLAGTSTSPEDAALIAEMMSLPNDGRYPVIDVPPLQRRRMTLQALVTQLAALADQSPVLMVLEDAHWADPTCLELFGRIVERVGRIPVLLVVTFRPEFSPPWVGQPHVTALTLNRMAERDVAAMMDRVLGNHSLPDEIRRDIIERTDGIPLFVEEMTKAVLESGSETQAKQTAAAVPSAAMAVPATLHASLTARLDRLGPAKEVVQIGAAIGREFPHVLLSSVAGKSEADLSFAIARLVEAGLLLQHGAPPHAHYIFKHALVQDAAYGLLLREPRRELHGRIAVALERPGAEIGSVEPEIVAYHYSEAGDANRACEFFETAGNRSVARSAYAEGLAHYRAALTESEKLPPGPERYGREIGILLQQGTQLMVLRGQRFAEIETVYQRAYDLSKESGDEQQLFKALWGLWCCANLNGKTNVAQTRAEELVELGERSGREEWVLEAIHCRWSTASFRGDIPAALVDTNNGLELYDLERHSCLGAEFGAHDPGVCAHVVQGFSAALSGKPRTALEAAQRSIDFAGKVGHPPSVGFATTNAMTTFHIAGDRELLSKQANEVVEFADRLDLPGPRALAGLMIGWLQVEDGDLEGGLRVMEAEYPGATAMGSMPIYYAAVMAEVRLQAGQAEQALDLLDDTIDSLEEPDVGLYLPEIYRLRGRCLLELEPENIDAAVSLFDQAIEISTTQASWGLRLRAAIDRAQAWLDAGNPEQGIEVLRDAMAVFEDDGPVELPRARRLMAELGAY